MQRRSRERERRPDNLEKNMRETSVTIAEGEITLEALHQAGNGSDAAIICHPHPLYGGSMENNVVSVLQTVLAKWGWETLRFNFRGVGGSGGQYDGGRGEVEDVLSAVAYLSARGVKTIHLAAYSYGVWVGLQALQKGLQPGSAILISPPLDFLDFAGLRLPVVPCLITAGERDSFCAAGSLDGWLASQEAERKNLCVRVLPGCDHFYWNREGLLSSTVLEFLQLHLPPRPAG